MIWQLPAVLSQSFLSHERLSCLPRGTDAVVQTLQSRGYTLFSQEHISLLMQRCLLHRTFPTLTTSFPNRLLSSLRCNVLKAQHRSEASTRSPSLSLRAASALAEAPSTNLGAGLPEIIETSNVPVSSIVNPHEMWDSYALGFWGFVLASCKCASLQVYLFVRRNELEAEALQQLIALAESPLPVGYVSAMPGTRQL